MEPTSGLSANLQSPDLSSVLSSCEPELQELMRQIDIMIHNQKKEWESDLQAMEHKLKGAQEELVASRNLNERKDLEIGMLLKQLEESHTGRQELVAKYEQQLQKVSEELEKLKRSYHKLHRKHLKESHGATKEKELSEEYQRHLTEWEQQRAQHQKQVTELENQNTSLNNEIMNFKSLLASRQIEWKLGEGQYHRENQVFSEERDKLHATLESQETLVQRSSLEHQRLRNEAARLKQIIQAKDQVLRSLEDCLAAQGCAGVEVLRQDLERAARKLHSAQACEVHLKAELACLKERLDNMNQQQAQHSKTEQEMDSIKAEYDSAVAQIKKLREELQRAKLTYSGEVEGMKKEVSKLTSHLHERDLSIATLSGSLSSIKQQLCREVERTELRAAEVKMTQAQLETLQTDNNHLRGLLHRLESQSPKMGGSLLGPQRESHVSSMCSLEQENRQLRQALGEMHSRLGFSNHDNYEQGLPNQVIPAQPQPAEDRTIDASETKLQEIQRLFKQLQTSTKSPSTKQSYSQTEDSRPLSSPSSCSSSSSKQTRKNSVPSLCSNQSAAEGLSSSSEDSLKLGSQDKITPSTSPLEPLSTSPAHGMVTRFLEEEMLRNEELLQRLDTHIQDMKESNIKTVSKYLPTGSGPNSAQASIPNGQ